MINYYEILGLNTGAGSLEIKNAFRRLAKLYHPDKNPNGKEQFNKILKAYEILSDPARKSTYDYRLKHQSSTTQDYDPKTTTTKNWRFDEKELKRRQYYNDYIKKETQDAGDFETMAGEKRNYSDYKYIFFATPLAVVLFLLIMKLATPYKTMPTNKSDAGSQTTQKGVPIDRFKTGVAVYNDVFGSPQYDSIQHFQVNINNETNENIIVCVFSKGVFLRSAYIKSHEAFDVLNLPGRIVAIKYCNLLDSVRNRGNKSLNAAMPIPAIFFKSLKPLNLKTTKEISLQTGQEGFIEITKEEFFKKD